MEDNVTCTNSEQLAPLYSQKQFVDQQHVIVHKHVAQLALAWYERIVYTVDREIFAVKISSSATLTDEN